MQNTRNTIGVCDSGIGGYSVLKKLIEINSGSITYVGDSMRAPYGNLEIYQLVSNIKDLINFLKSKDVNIFVNACNSLSSIDVKEILDLKQGQVYLDMISSTQRYIQDILKSDSNILIYATNATIKSEAYQKILTNICLFDTLASLNLARAIENEDIALLEEEIKILINKLKTCNFTHLLLACTHYPLKLDLIRERLEENNIKIEIIDPAIFVSLDVEKYLEGELKIQIYNTKPSKSTNFKIGNLFLEATLTTI